MGRLWTAFGDIGRHAGDIGATLGDFGATWTTLGDMWLHLAIWGDIWRLWATLGEVNSKNAAGVGALLSKTSESMDGH